MNKETDNMKRTLLALVVLLSFLTVSTKSYADEKEVTIPAPGKLKSLIDKKEYGSITSIVITGEINNKDMKVIKNFVNLETLDLSNAKQAFDYIPIIPKLKTLYLPKKCRNQLKTGDKISNTIRKNSSLQTIHMPGEVAIEVRAMPNLHKVGLYDPHDNHQPFYDKGKIPIDTVEIWDDYRGISHYVNQTYNDYLPKIILYRRTKTTVLNGYEPKRTDYKGINILPILFDHEQPICTPEILDLSDVISIPDNYFKSGTMKKIVFSEHLKYVGKNAFANCKNLKEVIFPGKNVSLKLDEWVFNGCSNLRYVHFLGPVIVRSYYNATDGNHCVVEFDKPSDIQLVEVSSPFSHFIFNAVPTEFKIGTIDTKESDFLSYIEVPANTVSSFSKFINDKYILEKGRKTKSYTLNLKKPGTILSNLHLDELGFIDSLTIVGFLYDTDMKIIEKCNRLSYLDLGRAVITDSPETLQEERQKMEAFKAIFEMAGAVADAKYDNFEMNALDHAYVKAFEQLAKGAFSVTAADDNCIIPSGSFSDRTQLKKVILPYRAKHIGNNVLCNCPKLESVELPLYLETIGNKSFMQCPKLKDLKFPSTLNYIGKNSFNGCNSIEVVDLSQCNFNRGYNTHAVWEWAFENCDNLKELHLPQGIKENKGANYIEINHKKIRPYALKVYIPANWEKFGDLSLWGNAELHFESPKAPGYFGSAYPNCNVVIYCPKGSTTSYYNAVGGEIDGVKIIEQ